MRSFLHGALFSVLAASAVLAGCGPDVARLPAPPTFAAKNVANLARDLTLPAAAGFAGVLSTQAQFSPYVQTTTVLTDTAPAGADAPASQTLLYIGLSFTLAVPSAPLMLRLQIPQGAAVSGDRYYAALLDPQRPELGWQRGFAGPVRVDSSQGAAALTFSADAPLFNRYEQYWLAVYRLPQGGAAPTQAPSVAPSVTPSPTPGAFPDIQITMGPSYTCSGTPCATGDIPSPQPTQQYQIQPVASPTVGPHSKFSQQLTIEPYDNQPGDVLYYTPSLGELPLATQFTWDFYVMVDQPVWTGDYVSGSPLTMQALEFDFNEDNPGEPGFDYNFSSQCLLRGVKERGPVWQIWGQTGTSTGWIDSPFKCDPLRTFVPFQWTHVTWTYRVHPDTLQTEYVSLRIQNATIGSVTYGMNALGPVQPLKKQAHPTIEVQFQQDARAITPRPKPFNEWVDDVTLTYQ